MHKTFHHFTIPKFHYFPPSVKFQFVSLKIIPQKQFTGKMAEKNRNRNRKNQRRKVEEDDKNARNGQRQQSIWWIKPDALFLCQNLPKPILFLT